MLLSASCEASKKVMGKHRLKILEASAVPILFCYVYLNVGTTQTFTVKCS